VATMKIEVPEMGENFSIYYGHSQLIQILIEGGIIGSLLFLGMLYICGKKIMKYQKSNMAFILTSGLFVNIIIMITEVPAYYSYYFILLALGYNIKYLVDQERVIT
jgi:O-antigen ligase